MTATTRAERREGASPEGKQRARQILARLAMSGTSAAYDSVGCEADMHRVARSRCSPASCCSSRGWSRRRRRLRLQCPRSASAAVDQAAPLIAEMNAQVERLRESPRSAAGFSAAGARSVHASARAAKSCRRGRASCPWPRRRRLRLRAPAPMLPKLVAVVTNDAAASCHSGGVRRRRRRDGFVKAGDTIGPFADSRASPPMCVELVDPI